MPDIIPASISTPFLSAAQEAFGHDRPRLGDSEMRWTGFGLPHYQTFQGIYTDVAKAYRWRFDEALRHNEYDARQMRRDGWLIALLRERQRPVGRAAWDIEAEDPEDPTQKYAVDLVTDLVKRIPRFSRMRMKLLEWEWYGRYGVQLATRRESVKGRPCWRVKDWLPVNGDKFVFRRDLTPGVMIWAGDVERYRQQGATVEPTERGYALFLDSPAWRQRFVIGSSEIDDADWYEPELAGGVAGVGLRHHVHWLWWLRAEVIGQLLDYLGRVGAGGLTVVWYEDGDDASKKKAAQVAKDLESNNVIIAPRGKGQSNPATGIDRIEPSQVGSSILIDIVDKFFESKIERLFIGQTLSGGTEGSGLGGTGVAALHASTKYAILQGCAEDLDETLSEDLVAPLLRWNVPGADFQLKFRTRLEKPDTDKALEAASKAYAMGVELVEDEVRGLAGLSKPQEGDKTLSQAKAQAGQSPGAMPGGMPEESPAGEPDSGNPGEEGFDEDNQSTPEIQQYFRDAVESGRLFDPDGLREIQAELERGDWRNPEPDVSPGPVQYAKPAKWSTYTNPQTGRSGWISDGGRVVYDFDPSMAAPDSPASMRVQWHDPKKGKRGVAKQQGPEHDRQKLRDDKLRRQVGVERGSLKNRDEVVARIGEMLDSPDQVTPASMRDVVASLMTLRASELHELAREFGGRRARKRDMAAHISHTLQGEGLPGPGRGTRSKAQEKIGDFEFSAPEPKPSLESVLSEIANDPDLSEPEREAAMSEAITADDRDNRSAAPLRVPAAIAPFITPYQPPASAPEPVIDPNEPFTWPTGYENPLFDPGEPIHGPNDPLWVRGPGTYDHREQLRKWGRWYPEYKAWVIPPIYADEARKLPGVSVDPPNYPKTKDEIARAERRKRLLAEQAQAGMTQPAAKAPEPAAPAKPPQSKPAAPSPARYARGGHRLMRDADGYLIRRELVHYVRDAQGHEHKGKGPGGGQFVSTGEGGDSAGDAPTAKPAKALPKKAPAVRGEMLPARRVGKGKDARLVMANGSPPPQHVAAAKIPPQWSDVQVSTDPKADVLATGRDAAGRAKVIYRDEFHMRNAAHKFARTQAGLKESAALYRQNQANRNDPRTREEADCCWLMQEQATRPGSDTDTKAKVQAYGATTLRAEHVVQAKDSVRLQFIGKEGVAHDHLIRNPELAKMLLERKKSASSRGGRLFDTNYQKTAQYAKSLDTGRFTPKDFRTIRANQLAIAAIQANPDPPKTQKEYKARVKAVAEQVSAVLGNRPAQALQSYIDPVVFTSWKVA